MASAPPAAPGAQTPPRRSRRSLFAVNPLRRILFGAPLKTELIEHAKLPKILALPVFASDAISSSVYATQEILLALSVAGAAALAHTIDFCVWRERG